MSFLANGKENVPKFPKIDTKKPSEMPWSEPNPFEKLNWLIHLQHVRGETLNCKELIKEEIKKSNGKNEFAFFKQGVILREEGKLQEALESFQVCVRLNNENVENIKEVAKCLFEMHRFRLALEAYLEAERVAHYPDWQIYYNIGQCLMRLGEISKSKEYAHKAVQLGKHENAYFLLIKILTSEGDFKAAISVCNAAIESCPDSVKMLTESGLLCLKMGQTQHAFERLSSALALDPICYKALLGVGCITQSHQEHDVALSKYKVAVSHEPNSVALWNNIGMCFYYKQKYIAAVSCLKRALWLSPTNWKVLFNLGLVHFGTYQPASAFNFLCAAVNLRPDNPHSFTCLGCALMDLNDVENAYRAFVQALSLAPDEPAILINNILTLTILKRKENAKTLLVKFNLLLEEENTISKEMLVTADKLTEYLLELDKEVAGDESNEGAGVPIDNLIKPNDGIDHEAAIKSTTHELTTDEV